MLAAVLEVWVFRVQAVAATGSGDAWPPEVGPGIGN